MHTPISLHTLGLPCLEQLPERINSPHLNGSQGTNRSKSPCQIRAKNDYEAVCCWLHEYRHKTTTYRAYQKEAERFLLWCVIQKAKALSSLDREDFDDYFAFLSNPEPFDRWCAPRGPKAIRGTPDWKPFEGPLKESSKILAIRIINSLITYLVYAQYLYFNPIGLMKAKLGRNMDSEAIKNCIWERILDIDEWEMMLITLDEMPENTPNERNNKARVRFLVSILYLLGLRIHELETHTWSSFRKVNNIWWFFVIGKGDKEAKIPVNDELLNAVAQYRLHFGLSERPESEDFSPIMMSFRTKKPIGVRHMNRIIKELAIKTSEKFIGQPEKQKKLKNFSPHWLRHLSATMQDRAGIKFKHIQANHRHGSEETTRRYVHAFDEERHLDMEKLSMRVGVRNSESLLPI